MAFALESGKPYAEDGQIRQGHHLGVGDHPARSNEPSKVPVEATNRVLGQPVQRGGGECCVEVLLGHGVDPCRVTQVG